MSGYIRGKGFNSVELNSTLFLCYQVWNKFGPGSFQNLHTVNMFKTC